MYRTALHLGDVAWFHPCWGPQTKSQELSQMWACRCLLIIPSIKDEKNIWGETCCRKTSAAWACMQTGRSLIRSRFGRHATWISLIGNGNEKQKLQTDCGNCKGTEMNGIKRKSRKDLLGFTLQWTRLTEQWSLAGQKCNICYFISVDAKQILGNAMRIHFRKSLQLICFRSLDLS